MAADAETRWRWTVLALFACYVGIRWYYFARFPKGHVAARGSGWVLDFALTRLTGALMFLPILLYLVESGVLRPCELPLPSVLRWAGAVVAVAGMCLLGWSHLHLRHAFSPEVNLADGQALVTTGPYRHVRHPMYTSFYVYWVGMALVAANWLVAAPGLVAMTVLLIYRLPREEQLMLEAFGDEYRAYRAQTGALLPRRR